MLQDNNPDAACMYHTKTIGRTERNSSLGKKKQSWKEKASPSRITSAKSCFVSDGTTFVGRAEFDFLVRFEKHSELYKCPTTCWLSPTLACFCSRCRALIGTYLIDCVV